MGQAERVAAGVACMVSVGWGVYDHMSGGVPWEPVLTFILSFAVWAFAESKANMPQERKPTLHPHDVKLGNELRTVLDERMKGYLREGPFSGTFRFESFDPISVFARWRGTEREFEDGELDNLMSEIVRASAEVDSAIAEHGNAIERRMEFGSFATDQERISDWYGRETALKIQDANLLARNLAELGDQFERVFRRLSPESYQQDGGSR